MVKLLVAGILLASVAAGSASEQVRDLAILLHNRIVGVPPDAATLQQMVELLRKGKAREAALLATEHRFFYDHKLRAMFIPWSNREGAVTFGVNDMVLTMIGMVRDDLPFNEVLSNDIVYCYIRERSEEEEYGEGGEMPPAAEHCGYQRSFNLKDQLHKQQQDKVYSSIIDTRGGISGILSTDAFGEAFYSAGTNRRATAHVLKNFLCHELEELHDTETPSTWVRQDVNRAPGGDPEVFNQRCVGCHAGLDALSGWSVHYDSGGLRYYPNMVRNKITKNNLLQVPHSDTGRNYNLPKNQNDSFTNLWTEGKNAKLGWRGETSGRGAKEFGTMITSSEAFSRCMVRHVYKSVCYLDPSAGVAKVKRVQLAEQFEQDNYNMRKLFAATAVACLTKNNDEPAGSGGAQ